MSGRGPTLAELLASNPAAREMLDKACPATERPAAECPTPGVCSCPDMTRCPSCGYTAHDKVWLADHHLCQGRTSLLPTDGQVKP